MTLKRRILLSLLLPQFALLLYAAFRTAQILRYELQFHESYHIGCIGMPFSPVEAAFYVFGLVAVIRLSGVRPFSRALYSVFGASVLALSAPEFFAHPDTDTLIIVLIIDILVLATIALIFFQRSYPHAEPSVA